MSKKYTCRQRANDWVIIEPDGTLADWPPLATEAKARRDVREFNEDLAADLRDDDGARSELVWQARMAGDMEAF